MKVPGQWQLPKELVERLGARTAGRQRALCAEGHLLLILHEPPTRDELDRVAVYFWRDPAGRWLHSGRGNGISCLSEHLARYRDAEERIDLAYRAACCASDYFQLLEELVPLQRSARNQHAALQAAREQVRGDRELISLRDEAGALERAFEILHADARNALEFEMARLAEEQARLGEETVRAGHRLNILAALFLPLSAVTGVFGMNLPLGLEQAPGWLTAAVLALSFAIGFGMLAWVVGARSHSARQAARPLASPRPLSIDPDELSIEADELAIEAPIASEATTAP